jgi:hypothetical protein
MATIIGAIERWLRDVELFLARCTNRHRRGDIGNAGEALPRPADDARSRGGGPRVGLIVWCKARQHQVEPDTAEIAERSGAETSVLDWRGRLVCGKCGGREIDMVVSGTRRPPP